ncbi:MAG: lipoate--protein ligase family protein [Opitutales bacterium]
MLPTRAAAAAENMALDFLLLQRYPQPGDLRFRHYGWRRPAFTFGYSQKIAFVRAQLTALAGPETEGSFDLCRRPTGGGVVDHRDDWTYALVIPRRHPLEEVRATESYRAVHEALAAALHRQQVPAQVKLACEPPAPGQECGPGGVCFQRAELYDVVHGDSGVKIAGAAQKRNKHGLLFQGSIWRPAAGPGFDGERLEKDFAATLAGALQAEAEPTPWPDFAEGEVDGLTEQYSSREWIEYR